MLNYNILENKSTIDINGEQGIDLLSKSIDSSKGFSGSFLEVNEYYIARPDLISLAVYGDDRYADIICKLNGISNPFELNEGQILFIPSTSILSSIINKPNLIETKRVEIKDQIANSNKIGDQKAKNERRTPGQQIVGDKNYIIDKSLGMVFY